MPNLLNQFKSYLLGSKHISPSTVKNYVSDINHFLNFVTASIQEPEVFPRHITPAVINTYRQSLTQPAQGSVLNSKGSELQVRSEPSHSAGYEPSTPPASINRRLSSLRRFGQFLADTKLADSNPAQAVINLDIDPTLTQVINHFKKHLQTEELSRSTIKNYVSDLKKYILWAQRNIKTTDNNINQRKLN